MRKIISAFALGIFVLGFFAITGVKTEAATVTKPIGSTFYKSALYNDYFKVQDSKGITINAKTTTLSTVTTYAGNKNFSTGTVSYIDYDKVAKVTYKTTTSAQAYTTASTAYKLTAKDYRGQTVSVKMPASLVVSKVSNSWYKGSFTYANYVKVNNAWVKQTKTAAAYVQAAYVKGTTSYIWTKYTKKATGYFWTPVNDGITLAEYNKLTLGMSYNKVLSITGQNLTLTLSSQYDGWIYKSYEWEYEYITDTRFDWRYASFDFENDKLTFKAQYGLK